MPIYMKYADIKGEVTAEGYKDQIDVSSCQWGVGRGISTPTGSAQNREASAPSVSEIVVTKPLDNASPLLLDEALQGEGKPCILSFVKTDKGKLETFLMLTLTDTMISGFSMSSGGDRPQESVSLNFTKVEYKNFPHKPDGTPGEPVPITYDVALAKVV